ncbi:3-hydroxyacyl-[acyl-carrier-protein] dehydratase FabZ, partial [Staphylococcus epidermidis]|uniref:3-hydroxyacyl-[acyl-carrier-protein] dehydratase FabZ n=1 Tax=Staphylococcus epidermidis TaxID=1282 RepID=UPI0037DA736E
MDKILHYQQAKTSLPLNQLSPNEPFFHPHFPNYTVIPALLITQPLAQTPPLPILNTQQNKPKIPFFPPIHNSPFKKQLLPRDTLIFQVQITKIKPP